MAFHRPYKRIGVEKGDERRVAGDRSQGPHGAARRRPGRRRSPGSPARSAGGKAAARSTGREGIELRAGDRIRWTRNDAGLGLVNSRTAEVASVANGRVAFRLEDGKKLELGQHDPQLRHLDHAWASRPYTPSRAARWTTVIAAMEARHPHLTNQKSFYVEISRARDRAELVTDDKAALRERLESVTGERIAALEAVEPERVKGREVERDAGPGSGREGGAPVSQERERTSSPEMEQARAPKGFDRDLGL